MRGLWTGVATAMAVALIFVASASATGLPVGGGKARIAFGTAFDKALRQHGLAVKGLGKAASKGRGLTLPVISGSYDSGSEGIAVGFGGGFALAGDGRAVTLRKLRLDTSTGLLSATAAGKRIRFASVGGAKLERQGFDVRFKARSLRLTGAGAAALNRILELPQVARAGRSLGSVDGLAEPSELEIASGQIAIGGADSAFSRLASLNVQMGIWGGAESWGEGAEKYFLFGTRPARVGGDASVGILDGDEDGVTMQLHEQPPRDMLLLHPRIDLAARELTATIGPLSREGALTGVIATLDYSAARINVRRRVGTIELSGIRAVASQFVADQLNTRLATPGFFRAGETLARMTVALRS